MNKVAVSIMHIDLKGLAPQAAKDYNPQLPGKVVEPGNL